MISYRLRKFKKSDVDSLAKYANNKNIAKFLTNEFPPSYSKEDAIYFIQEVLKENPIKTFAIEIDDDSAGVITLTPQSTRAELGYWLWEEFWNRGIATLAIEKMVGYGFNTFNIDYIFATPFIQNLASQKVLKKVDFKSDYRPTTITKNNEDYEVFVFSIQK